MRQQRQKLHIKILYQTNTLQKIRPVKKQIEQMKQKISKNRKKTKQRNQMSEEDRVRKSSTEA